MEHRIEEETLSFGLEHGTTNNAWEVIGTLSAAGYSQSVIDYAEAQHTRVEPTTIASAWWTWTATKSSTTRQVSAQWTGSDAVITPIPALGPSGCPAGPPR